MPRPWAPRPLCSGLHPVYLFIWLLTPVLRHLFRINQPSTASTGFLSSVSCSRKLGTGDRAVGSSGLRRLVRGEDDGLGWRRAGIWSEGRLGARAPPCGIEPWLREGGVSLDLSSQTRCRLWGPGAGMGSGSPVTALESRCRTVCVDSAAAAANSASTPTLLSLLPKFEPLEAGALPGSSLNP